MNKAIVAVVAFGLFTDFLLLTFVVPIAPEIFPDTEDVLVGFLFSSKAIVQIVAAIPVGYACDSLIGPHLGLSCGLLALAVSTALWAAFTDYWVLLVARGVQGIGSSFTMAGGMSLVAQVHNPDERGAAIGTSMTGVALGALLGPTIGGLLFHHWGQTIAFLCLVGCLAVDFVAQVLLWSCVAREERALAVGATFGSESRSEELLLTMSEPSEKAVQPSLLALLKDRSVVAVCVSLVAANSSIAMMEPLVPRVLKSEFGKEPNEIGWLWSAAPLAYVICTPLSGCLADRAAKWKLLCAGLLGFGVSLPWAIQFGPRIPLLVASITVAGGSTAFVDTPSIPLLTELVERRGLNAFGTIAALQDAATSLGFVLGPLAGEALATAIGGMDGVRWTFVTFGLVAAAIAVVAALLLRVASPH